MLARSGEYAVTVVEQAPVIGGVCATFRHGDFLLDYGPHKSYSAIPGILDELRELMGDEFLRHEKHNSIYLFGHYLKYPISMADLAVKMGFKNLVQSGFSAVGATLHRNNRQSVASYEQYVVNKFGRKLYELVFEPLADKVWGDPATLSEDIARTRIPSASVVDTALRALGLKRESEMTDAKYFYYPRQGFGRIPERMAEEITRHGGTVLTSVRPIEILKDKFTVTGVVIDRNAERQTLPCDLLVSTIPLPGLVSLLGGQHDPELKSALEESTRLQFRTAFLVYVFLRHDVITKHHWLFYPERSVVFGRVFEQKKMSETMAPQDRTVLCCDFTDSVGGELWSQSDDALVKHCIRDLERVRLIDPAWVQGALVKRLPNFYPRYDLHYKTTITALYESLKRHGGLLLTGRIGFYNYNNSDHCLDMGKFIAESLKAGKSTSQIWGELEKRVAGYKIVD
jgi:protoporphyrinogen oxidase